MIFSICIGYTYLLLIGFSIKGWIKKEHTPKKEHSYPYISVIVAARNEEKNIAELCKNLQNQSYPSDCEEFILISDHSTDKTESILNDFANTDERFVILTAPDEYVGKKLALHYALQHAHGDFILFTDADCSMGTKWIETYISYAQSHHGDFYFGNVIPTINQNSFLQKCFQLDFVGILAVQSGLAKIGHAFSCNGANMCITKDFYQKHYNTNTTYASGDDVFLLHEAKKANRNQVHFIQDDDCAIQTNVPQTLKEFIIQRIRWSSKSAGYKDFDAIIVACIVYALCVTMTITFVWACLGNMKACIAFCFLFITKTIGDITIFGITAKTYKTKKSLWLVIPFQCIYFIYITVVPILGMFRTTKWKERKL